MFLLNSRLSLVAAIISGFGRVDLHPTMTPLLPKLRGYFAEFLRESYLAHLGILYLTTCVGFGYGLYGGAISWNHFEAISIR